MKKMLCIVQGDNRNTFDTLMELNRLKCTETKSCKYFKFKTFKHVEPHWRKVLWTLQVMEANVCDSTLWMDGDAILSKNANVQNISSLFRGKHFVLSGENDIYHYNLSPFNAGVWLVHRLGSDILSSWSNVWHNKIRYMWNHTISDEWKCIKDKKTCAFSRTAYEQGAFNEFVYPAYKNRIRVVPWYVLQNPHPQTFVHHFIGPQRTKEKHIKRYMEFI